MKRLDSGNRYLDDDAIEAHLLKHMLEQRGFMEGNTTKPADFVIERAFVEQ